MWIFTGSEYAVLSWIVPWLSSTPGSSDLAYRSGVPTTYGVDGSRIPVANQESSKWVQNFKSTCSDFLKCESLFHLLYLWILMYQYIDPELEEGKKKRKEKDKFGQAKLDKTRRVKREAWLSGPAHLLSRAHPSVMTNCEMVGKAEEGILWANSIWLLILFKAFLWRSPAS